MRTLDEIYKALKEDFYSAGGPVLAEGGDMSLRLMAVAAEIFSLEAQCDYVLRQAFPQTAAGEALDRHAQVRALQRREAAKAGGVLRFYTAQAAVTELTVAAGTQCLNAAGAAFVTTEEGTIAVGDTYCDVAAEAVEPGEAGNAAAGTIVYIRLAPAGVSSVRNPKEFSGGSDAESDDELRERVLASYRRLPNGANVSYYESLVLGVGGVEKVVVLPRNRGRGTVDIVFSVNGGVPSETLVEQVRSLVQEQREICVDVLVTAPEIAEVDISAEISVAEGYDFESVAAAAEEAVKEYFGGQRLGEGVYLARLYSIFMGVEGVENCAIALPGADIAAVKNVLPVLGQLSIGQAV